MVRRVFPPAYDVRSLGGVTEDNRRENRYPARIVARLVRRSATVELMTNDVSFRGAFLRTDAPPALRQLVRVSFVMPTGEIVSAHAMVVHVVQPNGGSSVPGVGVQFWGPVEESKAWERYVYDLKVLARAGVASSRATDKVTVGSKSASACCKAAALRSLLSWEFWMLRFLRKAVSAV